MNTSVLLQQLAPANSSHSPPHILARHAHSLKTRPRISRGFPAVRSPLGRPTSRRIGSTGGNGGGNGGGNEGSSEEDDADEENGKDALLAIVLSIYGVVVGVGGVVGYLKKKSKSSLLAGLGSAIGIIVCAQLVEGPARTAASIVALGISGCLTLVMGKRAWSSRKFMPSGLVTSLSAVVTVLLLTSF